MQLALSLGAICAAGIAYLYFQNFGCDRIDLACLSNRTDVWGQAGDFFGGFLNPILSLITITYVYKTFKSERENQYWKVLDSILDGIEKALEKTTSDESVPLKNHLIELSGYSLGIKYTPENFVSSFKKANLRFAVLHNYLSYYANINSKVSAENRRIFNAALVCRLGRITVSVGIIQYLYVMNEIAKMEGNMMQGGKSMSSKICEIIIDSYRDFNYEAVQSFSDKAKNLAVLNFNECGKAKNENHN